MTTVLASLCRAACSSVSRGLSAGFVVLFFVTSPFFVTGPAAAQTTDGLTVGSDGRVGIGTSTPQVFFDVNGKFHLGLQPAPVPSWSTGMVTGDNAKIFFKSQEVPGASTLVLGHAGTDMKAVFGSEKLSGDNAKSYLRQWKGGHWHDQILMDRDLGLHFQLRKSTQSSLDFTGITFHEDVEFKKRIGIGTSSPVTALDVNGTITTTNLTETSARRFKREIRPLQGASHILERLEGVRYRWRGSGREDVGFIAEEVAEVLPEIVTLDENARAVGISYARLTAVLVEALKEERAANARHTDQIDQLRRQIESIQQRIDALTGHTRNGRSDAE